jgi:hypothetical protein
LNTPSNEPELKIGRSQHRPGIAAEGSMMSDRMFQKSTFTARLPVESKFLRLE